MRNRFRAAYVVDLLSLVPEYFQKAGLFELRNIILLERNNIIDRSTDLDNDEILSIILRLNIHTSWLNKRFRELSHDINMNYGNMEIPENFFTQEEKLTNKNLYGILERIINTYIEHKYQEVLKQAKTWYERRNGPDNFLSDDESEENQRVLIIRCKASKCCNQRPEKCAECDHSQGHPDTPRPTTPLAPTVPVVPRKSSESHIEIPDTLHVSVPEMQLDRVDTPLSVN
jgi:hypothetical protein